VNGVAGTASQLAVGDFHSCALQSGTGAVVCWGEYALGQTDVPASVNGTGGSAVAITTGFAASCAIHSGTNGVVCWGGAGDVRRSGPRERK